MNIIFIKLFKYEFWNYLAKYDASFNSGTSAFSSPNDNKENKDLKADAGLKSTTNKSAEGCTGYNSMEGEYTSTK